MLDERVQDSQFELAQITPVLQPLQDFQPMASGQFDYPKLHLIVTQFHKVRDASGICVARSLKSDNLSD